MEPWKARRHYQRLALVKVLPWVQLTARIRMEHTAVVAGGSTFGTMHVRVPRRLLHVPTAASVT
ncbi:MAG: hypothetical protein WCO90_07420 [Planctomycetota bacterium]